MSSPLSLSRDPSYFILTIRSQRVILDADLAKLYSVSTKALNQAVKRNQERFPAVFAFRLTAREKQDVVTNCDHLAPLKFSHQLPTAFTEHGALMAANVLNSPRAIAMSVEIVMAFVRLRRLAFSVAGLARKIDALESKYDKQFKKVFDAIRELMIPPAPSKQLIGFRVD